MICLATISFYQDIILKLLFPALVGTITFLLFRKLDDWKKRKSQSKLGVAIMDSLIEEVRNGIAVMEHSKSIIVKPANLLPRKSWDGLSTISDDILLRIIEVSEKVTPIGFAPSEIRIHCKNYFDHMTASWDNALENESPIWENRLKYLLGEGKFIEAATGVLKMLQQTKQLLTENSKKWFPK